MNEDLDRGILIPAVEAISLEDIDLAVSIESDLNDMAHYEQGLEALTNEEARFDAMVSVSQEAIDKNEVTATTAKLLLASFESSVATFNVNPSDCIHVSFEDDITDPLQTLEASMEEVKDFFKKAWAGIKKMWAKLMAFVKKIFMKIVATLNFNTSNLDKLYKAINSKDDSAAKTFDDDTATRLGKVFGTASAGKKGYTLSDMSDTITLALKADATKTIETTVSVMKEDLKTSDDLNKAFAAKHNLTFTSRGKIDFKGDDELVKARDEARSKKSAGHLEALAKDLSFITSVTGEIGNLTPMLKDIDTDIKKNVAAKKATLIPIRWDGTKLHQLYIPFGDVENEKKIKFIKAKTEAEDFKTVPTTSDIKPFIDLAKQANKSLKSTIDKAFKAAEKPAAALEKAGALGGSTKELFLVGPTIAMGTVMNTYKHIKSIITLGNAVVEERALSKD